MNIRNRTLKNEMKDRMNGVVRESLFLELAGQCYCGKARGK